MQAEQHACMPATAAPCGGMNLQPEAPRGGHSPHGMHASPDTHAHANKPPPPPAPPHMRTQTRTYTYACVRAQTHKTRSPWAALSLGSPALRRPCSLRARLRWPSACCRAGRWARWASSSAVPPERSGWVQVMHEARTRLSSLCPGGGAHACAQQARARTHTRTVHARSPRTYNLTYTQRRMYTDHIHARMHTRTHKLTENSMPSGLAPPAKPAHTDAGT